MSSVLKIVCRSSLALALIIGFRSLSLGIVAIATHQSPGWDANGTVIAGFIPDPSAPPVVTQGTGTR
jgi:hypothetical protein